MSAENLAVNALNALRLGAHGQRRSTESCGAVGSRTAEPPGQSCKRSGGGALGPGNGTFCPAAEGLWCNIRFTVSNNRVMR
jgi:hypothetical protein